jgi:hypothetical protein
MAGMAVILMCALAADDHGWRSTYSPSGVRSAVAAPATADVQPASAVAPWAATDNLVDRAERAVREGVNAWNQDLTSGGRADSRTAASGGGWFELESALQQSVDATPRAAATPKGVTARLRGPDVQNPVPLPPLSGAARDAPAATRSAAYNPPRGPAAGDDRRGAGSSRATSDTPPARGSIRGWLEEPEAPAEDELPRWMVSEEPDAQAAFPDGESPDTRYTSNRPSAQRRDLADPQRGSVPSQSAHAHDTTERQYIIPPPRNDGENYDEPLVDRDAIAVPRGRGANAARQVSQALPDEHDLAGASPSDGASRQRTAARANRVANDEPDRSARQNATTPYLVSDRPWWPLLMTVLGLFGSIGFNLYLGWIAWDLYTRYHDAVADVHELETRLEGQVNPS